MHPYSQPTLPLGHFANMVSYPFLPQNYSYMPSAFQQAFAGNSTYHQSLAAAAVLPQYKNSLSVSSLPQSGAAVPAGYGFGSSNNIPGTNFPLNQSVAPVGTNIGYDDALNSHYKEAAQLLSIQQVTYSITVKAQCISKIPTHDFTLCKRILIGTNRLQLRIG